MKTQEYHLLFLVLLLLGRASFCENGYCSRDGGCPTDNEEGGEARGEGALDDRGDPSTQSWNVFSAIRDTLTTVKDTVKYNAYKMYNKTTEFAGNVYEAVEDFSERVRHVFREEFSSFLEVMWESAVGTRAADDSLFQKAKTAIINKFLIVIVFILCLVLTYIIWTFSNNILTTFVWIITFNSTVLLAYKLLGAKLILKIFWSMVGYTWYTATVVWSNPYTSATVIFLLFLFSTLYSVYVWRSEVNRREWNHDMIRIINNRLETVENDQKKILERIDELFKLRSSQNSA